MLEILTAAEATALLRIRPDQMTELLESDAISYFMVLGEVRITVTSLTAYINARREEANRQHVGRSLQDPETWRRVIGADAGIRAQLRANNAPLGSFGAFLAQAISPPQFRE